MKLARMAASFILLLALALAPAAAQTPSAPRADLVRAVEAVGMTVGDMERSVDFYARVLGFEKLEFLEYLTPRDGRPAPADARANDLTHWQTSLVSGDAEGLARVIRNGACRLASPGVVRLPERRLGFGRGVLARDPDGHAFRIVEP